MRTLKTLSTLAMVILCFVLGTTVTADEPVDGALDDHKLAGRASGYRGIWYMNQRTKDEYVYKYSGGLGTYCAKHRPLAVYREDVKRTYFCYGGAPEDDSRKLQMMVSYFDHATGTVPRPVMLLDKGTSDAHDNPVLSVDDEGYIWIFSTAHGRSRPAYIHRSRKPHDIGAFDLVKPVRRKGDGWEPLTNFSYMQAWHLPERGFPMLLHALRRAGGTDALLHGKRGRREVGSLRVRGGHGPRALSREQRDRESAPAWPSTATPRSWA